MSRDNEDLLRQVEQEAMRERNRMRDARERLSAPTEKTVAKVIALAA